VLGLLLLLGLGGGVWYINSGQFTEVPPLLAKTEAEARDRLTKAGLEVGDVSRRFSDTVERGTVISTDPAAGDRVRGGGAVSLVLSSGPEVVKVPSLEGRPLEQARKALKDQGLEPGMVTRALSEDVPKGSVISTEPGSGTERRAGTAVALVVSKGAPVDVPDVTGTELDEARTELEAAGLKVRIDPQEVHSPHERGQVARQSPEPGGRAGEGDTVTLTLSKGPEMVEVPDVVGQSADEATETLEAAGFEVDEDRGLLGIFRDTVKSQSPSAGDKAPKGSTITLKIR
jgi:serine/threonine-protein kinase